MKRSGPYGLLMALAIMVILLPYIIPQVAYNCPKEESTVVSLGGETKEIGWRPMIGVVRRENMSGVAWVVVSIGGRNNDPVTYHICFLDASSDASSWQRRNPKTGDNEVYVLMKEFREPYNETLYFVRRAPPLSFETD